MDSYQRHQRIWKLLAFLMKCWIPRKFNLRFQPLQQEGPILLIANHTCAWDPILVATGMGRRQIYFVASEHLFRMGLVSRLINWLVAPIPRRKATLGTDTVKACLRHLRAGHSVCIFAEGEQCWDGRSQPVFPATGKLAKLAGVTLVTYRLEGGYLSLPRWGRRVRRGAVYAHPVKVYSPELLKTMSPEEINEAVDRDLYENAWERQKAAPVAYRGRRRAEGLERALYLCPGCQQIGSLRSKGDRLFCACGLDLCFTETGLFSPPQPFSTIADWEDWQRQALHSRVFPPGALLFSDSDMQLSLVLPDHEECRLGSGLALEQYEDRLVCGEQVFPLTEINSMAAVLSSLLLLSFRGNYYQIRAEKDTNLRKYLEIWRKR